MPVTPNMNEAFLSSQRQPLDIETGSLLRPQGRSIQVSVKNKLTSKKSSSYSFKMYVSLLNGSDPEQQHYFKLEKSPNQIFEVVNSCRDNTTNYTHPDGHHDKCRKQLIRVLEPLIDMLLKALQN
jgi:hypothetical protein